MSLVEHLEKLRHFHKLTSYRSINEGAQAMGISQAGLSKAIANLEEVLETTLFVRTNDGLILTKEGELTLAATKKIIHEAKDLETHLRSKKASHVPTKVRMGMYDSIAIYFFQDLTSYLNIIYPDIKFELVVDKSSNLAALLKKGGLDLAIGVNLQKSADQNANFFFLFEDHYSFYSAIHTKNNTNKLPLIFHPEADDEAGISNEKHLAKLTKSRIVHRAHNFETIKTLTALGLGIGVLPTQVAKPLARQNQLASVLIPKTSNLFGRHVIGFLAAKNFLSKHQDFVEDIYRQGERWAKT